MRRCLRAGALSALCLLLAFAAPCLAFDPCPALDAARSVAAALRDAKETELALEAASARCARQVVPLQGPAPRAAAAPAFDTEVEPNDEPAHPTTVFFYGGVAVIAGEINGAGDEDYYRYFLDGPARIWLQTDTGGVPPIRRCASRWRLSS
jgi:hypothetical protein